jgi:uncharacterized protein
MEENLESFVNLLNRQRQPRPVPKELSGLPNWAQRELSKHVELTPPAPVTPPAAPPVNGTAHENKPKPEIKVEATVETKKVDANPVEPPKKQAAAPPPPPKPAAPPMSAAERVRDPQTLLARILAEETKSEPPKSAKPMPASIVIDQAPVKSAEPEKKREEKTIAPPPEKKLAAEKMPEKIIDKKVEAPAKIEPVPVLTTTAEIVPMQPVMAEAMASPRARRRPAAAYGFAAAAVIAVVALVVGAYWYANRPELIATNKITKPLPSPSIASKPTPPAVAAKPTPPIVTAKPNPPVLAAKPTSPVVAAKPAAPTIAAKPPAPATPEKKIVAVPSPAVMPTPIKPEAKIAVKPPEPSKPEAKVAVVPVPGAKPTPPAVVAQKPVEKTAPAPAAKPAVARDPQIAMVAPTPAAPQSAKPTMAPAAQPSKQVAAAEPVKSAAMPALPPPKPEIAATNGDEPTWRRNALPAPPFSGQPQIAIVIDDLGLDRARTERAVALKGPVTLSFLAYASDLPQQTEAARRAGHELIVHVPMEPIVKPKYVTQTSAGTGGASRTELLRRLRWDLSRFNGYVGVNNHMGNRLGADPDSTQTVINELKSRGLLFLDSRATSASALSAAERQGVPTVTRDVLLDDDISAGSVNDRLAELERVARQRGTAIAIGHPHDLTLDALNVWLANLPAKGLQLVPLTAIVKEREQHVASGNRTHVD